MYLIIINNPFFNVYFFDFLSVSETEWHPANTGLVERQSFMVRNLPTGEKVNFRVVAVNIAGQSPPALLGQSVTVREIMGKHKVRFIKHEVCL